MCSAASKESEDAANALADRLVNGARDALAETLNLLDDRREQARARSSLVLTGLLNAGTLSRGHLIGITGPPGVGKSSLTAALIRTWRARDQRVGVLAVDPSSPHSGGALLGDRLRMQATTDDSGVFIRSLSSRGEFGGLSKEVWPMAIAMLAGCDIVLIETVGVGQREIDIAELSDTTCFIAQPGSGDSIQFLKAGVLEVPDILVVNKSDLGELAQRTLADLSSVMGGTNHSAQNGWQVPVLAVSAATGDGVAELDATLVQHYATLCARGPLNKHRQHYQAYWVHKRLSQEFGSQGITQLGGDSEVLQALGRESSNPIDQLDEWRQRATEAAQQSN